MYLRFIYLANSLKPGVAFCSEIIISLLIEKKSPQLCCDWVKTI